MVIGVDAPEQCLGRLVEEVGEDLIQRAFAGIGARRQSPAVAETTLGVEGQAPLEVQVVAVLGVVGGEEFGRTVGLVGREGEVGDPHGKPVALSQRQVAQEQLAVARRVEHGDLDGLHPLRQDFLADEVPLGVHRHGIPGQPDAVPGRDRAPLGLHRSAVQRDVPVGDAAFAVTDQQFLLGVRLGDGRIELVDHPQRLGPRLVEVPRLVVDPDQVFQLAQRGGEGGEGRLPLRGAVVLHRDDGQGVVADRLLLVENPDLRPCDEAVVVGVQAEADQILGERGIPIVPVADRARPGAHVQPRLALQAVVFELDPGPVEGHVGAALHVRDALVRVVDRLAVDGDAHEIQAKGVGRTHLAGQRGDLHPVVVIARDELVVDDLHLDAGGIRLDKAGVDHVVRLDVAAPLELRALCRQPHLLAHGGHGPARPGRGQPDVVPVDGGNPPVQPFVAGVADKPQAEVAPVPGLLHDLGQASGAAGGQNRLAVFEQDRRDPARRRVVDPGDRLGAGGFRAELGLVGQLLQRIVVPEFHLDPPVQGPSLGRVVGGERPRRAPPLALDGGIGQAQGVLDSEGNPPGHGLRQSQLVAVDALVPLVQGGVVGIGGKLDDDMLLAVEIVQSLPDQLQEFLRDLHHPLVVMEGGDEVPHPGPMGVPFLVAQLADGLGAADLDAIHVVADDHFLLGRLFTDLVVPDLHLHAPVAGAACLGRVAGGRLAVAHPFVGDRLGGKPQGALEIFGDGSRPLPGKPDVVAVAGHQVAPQRQVVGMADKVEAHVPAIAHALEHPAQQFQVVLGNLRLAQGEEDGRDQVVELDRFHDLLDHLHLFRAVPLVLGEEGGILGPQGKALVGSQVHFDGLAARRRFPHPRAGVRSSAGRLRGGGRTCRRRKGQG